MSSPGLGSWIERRASLAPADTALVVGDDVRSYRRLADDVRRIACVLHANGIRPSDRVAFHGTNHPVVLASLFTTRAIGASWVPIHPARPEDEVRSILDDADVQLLVRASPDTHPDVSVPEVEAEALDGAAEGGSSPEPPAARDPEPDEVAILAYTSGTTGPPKGSCSPTRTSRGTSCRCSRCAASGRPT